MNNLSPYEGPGEPRPRGRLDEIAFAHWRANGITPARPCSDAVFLRRAFLGLIGTLPTPREAREFLLDRAEDKRTRLVEQLLTRREYAWWWALRWSDALRIKSEFPINLWPNAVQAYHRWVLAAMASGMPLDRFARELLTASGSNFRVPQVNFYRAVQSRDPESLARAVALTFMGVRAERWPRERLLGMAAFFEQVDYKKTLEWKEEIVFHNPRKRVAALKGVQPRFPDGKPAVITPGRDPRQVFAEWLTRPGNPWFARSLANRIWFWLFGQGIAHEADDIRPDNPPRIPGMLEHLAQELESRRYDMRRFLRYVTTSAVYQLSPVPRTKPDAAREHFACYPVHRLEAEALLDALNQVTGSTDAFSSPIPEPFTFVPEEERTITLADGSITSPFLELFGRPPRDTGLLSERNTASSAGQRLHFFNSSHVQRKIRQGRLRTILTWVRQPRDAITELYLMILSRFPTPEEESAALEYVRGARRGEEPLMDVAWALLNSAEFAFHH